MGQAGRVGFEPTTMVLETIVLPLNYLPDLPGLGDYHHRAVPIARTFRALQLQCFGLVRDDLVRLALEDETIAAYLSLTCKRSGYNCRRWRAQELNLITFLQSFLLEIVRRRLRPDGLHSPKYPDLGMPHRTVSASFHVCAFIILYKMLTFLPDYSGYKGAPGFGIQLGDVTNELFLSSAVL